MADDVVAVLESGVLGDAPVYGVGHSMGGAALVMAADRLPEPSAPSGSTSR